MIFLISPLIFSYSVDLHGELNYAGGHHQEQHVHQHLCHERQSCCPPLFLFLLYAFRKWFSSLLCIWLDQSTKVVDNKMKNVSYLYSTCMSTKILITRTRIVNFHLGHTYWFGIRHVNGAYCLFKRALLPLILGNLIHVSSDIAFHPGAVCQSSQEGSF